VIKVMLVDDHALVRIGIKSLLTNSADNARAHQIEIISEASSGEEAIQLIKQERPDVILMDVKMPGIGGLEATNQILAMDPTIKIVAVTACDEDPFPSRMLQAGAVGYVTKTCGQDKLLAAIECVQRGGRYITPGIAQQLAVKHISEPADSDLPFDALSERELQVMMMITNGHRVQEIAEKLGLSPKTINTYRYRIFEKMKITSDVELTHIALRYKMLEKESILPQSNDG
jgi:two-component system, NarL family, invasion response regulator UvrY